MTAPTKPQSSPATATPTPAPSAAPTTLHTPVISWFETHARDLPWRRPEAGPWG